MTIEDQIIAKIREEISNSNKPREFNYIRVLMLSSTGNVTLGLVKHNAQKQPLRMLELNGTTAWIYLFEMSEDIEFNIDHAIRMFKSLFDRRNTRFKFHPSVYRDKPLNQLLSDFDGDIKSN